MNNKSKEEDLIRQGRLKCNTCDEPRPFAPNKDAAAGFNLYGKNRLGRCETISTRKKEPS